MRAPLIFKCFAERTYGGLALFVTKLCERIIVPCEVMNKMVPQVHSPRVLQLLVPHCLLANLPSPHPKEREQ